MVDEHIRTFFFFINAACLTFEIVPYRVKILLQLPVAAGRITVRAALQVG